MATQLHTGEVGWASGVNFLDIYQGSKDLLAITEEDWIQAGVFREGTFNFTGDDQTVTEIKSENGTVIVSTVKDGTYGFEGNNLDIGIEPAKLFLKMEDVDVETATGWLKDKVAIRYNKIANLQGLKIRLRFEAGAYESIVYPNATLTSKLIGAGSTEDVMALQLNCSAAASNDPAAQGGTYILVEREA